MKCSICGANNIEGSRFCSDCGMELLVEKKDNIKCKSCGFENNIDHKFCAGCGMPLSNDVIIKTNKPNEDTNLPNILGTLSIVFYFIFPIIGLALMIYTRVKYPNNVIGKVSMWFAIVFFILVIVVLLYYLVACGYILESCSTIG